MNAPTIVVEEYGEVEITLTHAEVAELRTASGTALTVAPGERSGRWVVKVGSQVGTIVTPAVRLLIRPKVPAANLFHMLEASADALSPGVDDFDYGSNPDLAAAFATFFLRHLERSLSRGLVRTYLPVTEPLTAIRGRVVTSSLVRAGGLPTPVECEHDEYTLDHQLNRVVAAAVARLVSLPGVSPAVRRSLLQARAGFEGVGRLRRSDIEQPTTFTRLNEHFRATEHLARLVLAGTSIVDQIGTAGASTFLINMWAVFERFVETGIRRELSGDMEVLGQTRWTLDHEDRVPIRPDLVFRRHGQPVLVGDVKYKLTRDGVGRQADYYQLLAYCTALGLTDGVLI